MKQFSPLTIYIFSIKQESRVNKQKGTTFHILLSICTKLAKSRHTAYVVVYQYTYNILVGSVSCCCCSRFQPSKSPPHHSKEEELAQSVGVLQPPPPPPTTTTSCFLFDEQTLKWREAGNIGKIVLKASRNLNILKCLASILISSFRQNFMVYDRYKN